MKLSYDAREDYMKHIAIVKAVGSKLVQDLSRRLSVHDASKIEEPEKSCYVKYVPMLKEVKYGTQEYYDIRQKMLDEGLSHHYEVNRHHPEHFANGIEDMTIVDLMEYFIDTYSASQLSDTPYEDGVKKNQKTHNLPDVLVKIFINTVNEYFEN